jgi:hypothetical protein
MEGIFCGWDEGDCAVHIIDRNIFAEKSVQVTSAWVLMWNSGYQ